MSDSHEYETDVIGNCLNCSGVGAVAEMRDLPRVGTRGGQGAETGGPGIETARTGGGLAPGTDTGDLGPETDTGDPAAKTDTGGPDPGTGATGAGGTGRGAARAATGTEVTGGGAP